MRGTHPAFRGRADRRMPNSRKAYVVRPARRGARLQAEDVQSQIWSMQKFDLPETIEHASKTA